MQFCLPKFLGPLLQKPPQNGPLKLIFLIAQARVIVFFIRRYFNDKCFDMFWGYRPPPRRPQIDPQKSIFDWLKLEHEFLISADVKKNNSLTWFERATSLKTVQNDVSKIFFFVCC